MLGVLAPSFLPCCCFSVHVIWKKTCERCSKNRHRSMKKRQARPKRSAVRGPAGSLGGEEMGEVEGWRRK